MDTPECRKYASDGRSHVQHVRLGLCQCTRVGNAFRQSHGHIPAKFYHHPGGRTRIEGRFAGIDYGVCNLFGSVRRVFLAFELAFCHAFACIFANACEQLVKSCRHGIAIFQLVQNICERQNKSLGRNTFILSAPVFRVERVVAPCPGREFRPEVVQCWLDFLPDILCQAHHRIDHSCAQNIQHLSDRGGRQNDRIADSLDDFGD